jgi:hypothetical protein
VLNASEFPALANLITEITNEKCHVHSSKRYRRTYNAMMAAGSSYQTIAHAWIGTSWHRIMKMYREKHLSTS